MPLYDYTCLKCGTEVKDVRKSIEGRMSDAPICEKCNKQMKLLVASPSFKIMDSFRERLNKNYDKHKAKVKAGEAQPNSIDRHRGNIG